jgi:isopentenyldiphosphate isomerase/protein-tyrosine-phosphatase
MVILFVCKSNTYRSRIADAYARSLNMPGVTFGSAGVEASLNPCGPSWKWTNELLKEEGLAKFDKPHWTQLTQSMLSRANIVVCMNRSVYDTARRLGMQFPLRTFIWGIQDVTALQSNGLIDASDLPLFVRRTFGHVKEKVGELTVVIRRPKPHELVDVTLEDGTLTGRTADVDTIHTKGLWHRGVHGAVFTETGEVLLQRRSKSIIYNPGLWDLTFGGIVAAGEEPEEALLRELREEMGVASKDSEISKLFVWRYNHFWPHYGLHSRVLTHTYLIKLKVPVKLRLQTKEVSDGKFVTLTEATQFFTSGKSALGETTPAHQYYHRLLSDVRHAVAK